MDDAHAQRWFERLVALLALACYGLRRFAALALVGVQVPLDCEGTLVPAMTDGVGGLMWVCVAIPSAVIAVVAPPPRRRRIVSFAARLAIWTVLLEAILLVAFALLWQPGDGMLDRAPR